MHGKISREFCMNIYSSTRGAIDRVKRKYQKIAGSKRVVDSAGVKITNNPMGIPYFPKGRCESE
jgi:hypothetical protein